MQIIISKTIPRIFFFILFAVCVSAFAAGKPTAYDVDALWQEAYQTVEDFHEQSLSLRLKYDHAGTFVSDEHKSKLLTLGKDTDSKLKEVYDEQRHLRADIEAYDNDDWDKLYGVTGLWKSVYASEFETQRLRKEVAYYIAIASPPDERLQIADNIIGWCDSDKNRFKNAQTKLLKAKASALIGETSKGYRQQAMQIVEDLANSKDYDKFYFHAVLLRFDIVGDVNRALLTEMAEKIAQSGFSEEFELNVRVAFAGLKIGETKYLDEVISKWPGAERFVAEIILDRLNHLEKNGKLGDDLLVRQSVSEITLALKAAIEKSAADYIRLLERLERTEKFRCSLLSYALAQAYVNENAVLAVEHYIAAATRRNIDRTLSVTKLELAQKGASIAAELYGRDKKYCGIAGRALLFYCHAAGAEADADTAALYFQTLDACLGKNKAAKQLERLAGSDDHFVVVPGLENGVGNGLIGVGAGAVAHCVAPGHGDPDRDRAVPIATVPRGVAAVVAGLEIGVEKAVPAERAVVAALVESAHRHARGIARLARRVHEPVPADRPARHGGTRGQTGDQEQDAGCVQASDGRESSVHGG